MTQVVYPSEVIDLPSKGYYYPADHPLANGTIELRYMTAKDEDILTSINLIKRGVVIDKLMENLIVDKSIKYQDMFIGDKNGIILASRIMAYGKDYNATMTCPECEETQDITVNLEEIEYKTIQEPSQKHENKFTFTLPVCGKTITFKLLTLKDDRDVSGELDAIKKIMKSEVAPEITMRMKKSIMSVDGNSDQKYIRDFVDAMPIRDSRAFREYARTINPDVDMHIQFECTKCGHLDKVEVPVDVNFFWPDLKV